MVLALVGRLVGARWYVYERPLPMRDDRAEFRVKPGASARGVAQAVREAGIDVNELAFAALSRATGVAQSLRAGRYTIERGITLAQLIAKLRAGDVTARAADGRRRHHVPRDARVARRHSRNCARTAANMSAGAAAAGDRRQRSRIPRACSRPTPISMTPAAAISTSGGRRTARR